MLLRDLENRPGYVQLYYGELAKLIAWCMDEVCRLAKTGIDDSHKMRLVALEYRVRLLLERWRKLSVN